jgi:hypothetical protein
MGGVAALAAVCDNDTQLDGRPVTAWGVLAIRGGDLEPAIVNGRAPAAASEVALAAKTLEALHKHVGDSVRGPKPKHARYRIVGTVVLPTLAYPQPLADGALFTNSGFLQAYDANSRASRNLIGRFTPSADRAVLLRAMSARQREAPARTAATPIEIEHLRDVTWIPRVLAALLAGLALVAVGHALVTATRNRRRDFATLKTLGFTRSQVSATVAWQATAFGAVGLLFGVPLGVLVGRLAWQIVADSLGVSPAFAISVVSLVVVPAALVVANLVAIVPARTAARIRPARALRAE